MTLVTLVRWASNPRQVLGRMGVGSESWLTVERSKTDATHPCIPAGTYPMKLGTYFGGDGPGGKEDYPSYEILNVPGRSLIKIHGANKASQLLGCIAPGMTLEIFGGEIGVTSSRAALNEFMAAMKSDADGEIQITEAFG
jgi:hypothetical protein